MRHKKQAEAGDFFFCLMFLSGKKGPIMLNEIIKTAEELNTAAALPVILVLTTSLISIEEETPPR